MRHLFNKNNCKILRHLGLGNLWYLIRTNLWSHQIYFLLQLNLNQFKPYDIRKKPSGKLLPLSDEDVESIYNHIGEVRGEERRELLGRVRFAHNKFPHGHCIKVDEKVVYVQWLIEPKCRDAFEEVYPNRFKPLNDKQVMLENAYTWPEHRGKGYYYYISSQLLQQAKENGYKFAVGYVRADKMDSFNAMLRLGFRVTHVQKERKILGCVRREFFKGKEF